MLSFLLTPASASSKPSFQEELPTLFPEVDKSDSAMYAQTKEGPREELTIVPYIQANLDKFLKDRGSPIAAVVLADVRTGNILAMSQGEAPDKWGSTVHSALYPRFPAASLFKTIVASAAFELTSLDADRPIGLNGGCANVRPTGIWLQDEVVSHRRAMTMRKAYGHSCNGYFAKIAVNLLGLSAVSRFAQKFGWDGEVTTDFKIATSPMNAPITKSASVHAVGRYAAGFGAVGLSPVHATWITMAIANNGLAKQLNIFKSSADPKDQKNSLSAKQAPRQIVSAATAAKIKDIMEATVRGGTSSFAFRRGKYRKLREIVGGKTGTLTGYSPKGVTTWFTGVMPRDNPEVVVSAVVVLDDLWHIKGPNLAAEALSIYSDYIEMKPGLTAEILGKEKL